MKRFIPTLVIVVLGCHSSSDGQTKRPSSTVTLSPAQVRDLSLVVETVDEQPIDDSVKTSGRITFDDMRVAHVFSPVSGKLVRMDAKLGQHVKKGDSLAVMQSPDVSQASSDLRKADADLIAAIHDLDRKKALFATKAGSAVDLEASQDTYEQAKAERARALQKAALFQASHVSFVTEGYALLAPIDGEVIARYVNPGTEIQGQYGGGGPAAELYTIGELDSVWVLANLYETELPRVASGQKVEVDVVAYPERHFEGTVDWVSNALDPATRTAKVRCTFANADRALRPEMYGSVKILVQPRSVLAIPHDAVVPFGEQQVVFVVDQIGADGSLTVERLPITADSERPNGRWLPVLHGLDKGQKVLVGTIDHLSQVL